MRLKYLCSSFSTTLAQSAVKSEGQYKVYGASGLVGYLDEYELAAPYLGIVKDGAGVGRIRKYDGCTSLLGTLAYIVPNEKANIDWLKYVIQSLDLGNDIDKTTIPHVYFSEYGNRKVRYVSLDEQQRIATFLDGKCARIDSVIEKTRASIEEYKKLKQALITRAVTKGIRPARPMKHSGVEWLGDIPAHWTVIKIKWLFNERNERSENGEEEPLSMSQKYGLIPTKEMDIVPNMAASFVGAKLCYKNDLVFNKLKAHLGVFAVSKYYGLVSPDYAVYYASNNVNLKYLEYLFKTPQYIGEFRKKSTGVGAGLTRLYTAGLYSIYCLFPPLEEQKEIAQYLDEKTAAIDLVVGKKNQLVTELERLKKSLIFEYVTGKKAVAI